MAVLRRPCTLSALLGQLTAPIPIPASVSRSDTSPAIIQVLRGIRNYSSYGNSPLVYKITDKYEYEVVVNPPEWKYVERLLPFETIPKIKPKDSYPSGFIPPREEAVDLPYFLPRTKNHQVPIYLGLTHKGNRRISQIRKIEGDIWAMNDEIKSLLKQKRKRYVETKVHEFTRSIEVKGDYVLDLKEWAYSKGF